MRNLIFIFALVFFSCNKNKNIPELKGKLTNSSGEKIYLEQLLPESKKIVDSAVVDQSGTFTFSTEKLDMGFYNVKISEKNFAMVILDKNQNIEFTGDAKSLGNTYNVKGSPDSELFLELNKASEKNYGKRDSLTKIFNVYLNSGKVNKNNADSIRETLQKPFDEIIKEHTNFLVSFIEKNPSSLASLAAVEQLNPEENFKSFETLDKGLTEKYPGSPYTQLYHKRFLQLQEEQKILPVGSPAPEIVINDENENPVKLSSLKGKVVLIDFWASWCKPCRAENPNIVKAYEKFKPKGLEIYAVSLDRSRDRWIEAIKKDNLTWIHVSDFKEWNSPVVEQYGFGNKGIPFNVLIDKEGKIIAKGLRGKALEAKLKEILE